MSMTEASLLELDPERAQQCRRKWEAKRQEARREGGREGRREGKR